MREMGARKSKYWDALYSSSDVKNLPWYYEKIDPDLEEELKGRAITRGSFLDLCTGPATQAIALSRKGFVVVGTDISKSAIERAKTLSSDVEFKEADMRKLGLGRKFDYIFDRGCFHILVPSERPRYIKNVKRLLNENGLLFLKCFSKKEPGWFGPHRFSEKDIRKIFEKDFIIERIKETGFPGGKDVSAKALFVVMKPLAA